MCPQAPAVRHPLCPLSVCAIPMGQGAQCSGGKEQTSRGSGLRVAMCFQPACPTAVFSSGQGRLMVGSWQPEAQGEQGSEEKLPPQHTTISLHFFLGRGGGKQVGNDSGPFQTLGVKSCPTPSPEPPSPGLPVSPALGWVRVRGTWGTESSRPQLALGQGHRRAQVTGRVELWESPLGGTRPPTRAVQHLHWPRLNTSGGADAARKTAQLQGRTVLVLVVTVVMMVMEIGRASCRERV